MNLQIHTNNEITSAVCIMRYIDSPLNVSSHYFFKIKLKSLYFADSHGQQQRDPNVRARTDKAESPQYRGSNPRGLST